MAGANHIPIHQDRAHHGNLDQTDPVNDKNLNHEDAAMESHHEDPPHQEDDSHQKLHHARRKMDTLWLFPNL